MLKVRVLGGERKYSRFLFVRKERKRRGNKEQRQTLKVDVEAMTLWRACGIRYGKLILCFFFLFFYSCFHS